MADIAIVGAGITGLTTAYLLQKEGHTVHLFEKKLEIGGAIRSEYSNGWLTEYGPNTLLLKDAEIYQFLRSEEHTSELQSRGHLVCRLLLEKQKPDTTTRA